jgi:hypothetical protein
MTRLLIVTTSAFALAALVGFGNVTPASAACGPGQQVGPGGRCLSNKTVSCWQGAGLPVGKRLRDVKDDPRYTRQVAAFQRCNGSAR